MDTLTPRQRSARMAKIKGSDTKPEIMVRRLVHRMGFRYRLHVRKLPGSPDLVFSRHRAVIFVHGCFWHRHPDPTCKLARLPKSRIDFWGPKLDQNHQRDLKVQKQLSDDGWRVLIIWECELRDPDGVALKVKEFLA